MVLRINPPTQEEIGRLADGATLIGMLAPGLRPELVEALAARPITALALDAVPRISRAVDARAELHGEHRRVSGCHLRRPTNSAGFSPDR